MKATLNTDGMLVLQAENEFESRWLENYCNKYAEQQFKDSIEFIRHDDI